jgi:hypothetical protein
MDDFVTVGMKSHKVPGTGQYGGPAVYQVADVGSSNPAGQMMVRADGSKTIMSYPGYDKSKIEIAFNTHANGGTSAAVATASTGNVNSSASVNSTAAASAPASTRRQRRLRLRMKEP